MADRPRRRIDLRHTAEDCLITYKGLPAPVIGDYLSYEASREHYAEGTTFHIGKIEMVANTGTYLDAPFHRFATGFRFFAVPVKVKAFGTFPARAFASIEP